MASEPVYYIYASVPAIELTFHIGWPPETSLKGTLDWREVGF